MSALVASIDHEISKFPKVQGGIQQVYLSQLAQKVLNQALKYTGNLKDEYVSTEHLLLGMTHQDAGNLAKILNGMGLNEKALMQILKELPALRYPAH